MRANAREPLTVEAVATAILYYSCVAAGISPMAALRQIRLEAARKALADGPTSIRAVAAAYRFTNPGRFARLFKEVFGQFPSELRRAQDRPTG